MKNAVDLNTITIKQILTPTEEELTRMTAWLYLWWGKAEGYSPLAVRAQLTHSFQKDALPRTYGMYAGGTLIGMYQFTLGDLFVRPDLYPWLANVYLLPEYRGMGLGKRMILSAIHHAKEAGFVKLWLFTAHKGLYEPLGFTFFEEVDTILLTPRTQRIYSITL